MKNELCDHQKNVALTAEEDLLSDRDAISTNELALDLNATTRSTIDGRIFWKGNVLVRLGRSDTDLSLFLQGFTAASSDAFKEAFLLYADSKQPGLELVMHVARILRAISKELSPISSM
ncbi:hypothetical protein OMD46_15075 [Pseudomonas sp. MDMC_285]|nr:hypothetical protein [Pseudomonas sp. MDMC_285]